MGAYLKEKLFALKEKYPCISDVRGIGLMVAIEFSHKDGSPAPDIAVVVNNSNPMDEMSSDNVKDIFTGAVTTWDEVAK